MGNKPKAGLGGIVGVMIGVVIVGAIAATPFYLGMLESNERALRAAAQDDVELIRRAVMNLDGHLAAIADADAAMREEDRLTPQMADEIKSAHPEVLGEGLVSSLNQTLHLITQAEGRDAQRGIVRTEDGSRSAGALSANASVSQMRREYLQANAKLQSEAKTAIDRLRTITRGQDTAAGLPEVTRIQAMYYLTTGRMLANRGRLQDQLRSNLCSAVFQRLAQKAQLRQDLEANQANDPKSALADVESRIEKLTNQIAANEADRDVVKAAIEKLSASIAEEEAAAAAAWSKARELEPRLARGGAETETRYRALTEQARRAEAKAAELRCGLRGPAGADADAEDDEAAEHPAANQSLDALTIALRTLEQSLETRNESRRLLEAQHEQLTAQARDCAAQRTALQNKIAECDNQLSDLVKQQNARFEAGVAAYGEALKSYKLADEAVQAALRTAKARTRNAAEQARSAGTTPDERLDMIAKDADTEASLLCQAGEIAYARALTNAKLIEGLKSRALLNSSLAEGGKGEEPAAAQNEIASLREEAMNRLADAAKNFEAADKMLAGASIKTAAATVTGKNYEWQCQVGLAAVYLLRASIAELVDGSPDRESVDKAYELLKQAAEGREQSPLLSTALDTLQYLQRTAH